MTGKFINCNFNDNNTGFKDDNGASSEWEFLNCGFNRNEVGFHNSSPEELFCKQVISSEAPEISDENLSKLAKLLQDSEKVQTDQRRSFFKEGMLKIGLLADTTQKVFGALDKVTDAFK